MYVFICVTCAFSGSNSVNVLPKDYIQYRTIQGTIYITSAGSSRGRIQETSSTNQMTAEVTEKNNLTLLYNCLYGMCRRGLWNRSIFWIEDSIEINKRQTYTPDTHKIHYLHSIKESKT